MFRYAHTNIIAKDSEKLIRFYKEVLECKSIGETRDLKGDWLDKMTGVNNAHIVGEHLLLPGYGDDHPTLEIFSYDNVIENNSKMINTCGFAHLAFEVDDVEASLKKVIAGGGSLVGELVHTQYADGKKAVFVYAADPEGNILELQNWSY